LVTLRALLGRHRFLVTFVLLNSLMGVSVGLAKVATPLYALHLGASEALLALLAGSQSAGILLLGLPMGFLVDRYGPSGLFVIGSLCAGAMYMVVPLIPSPLFLVACTFVISFFMPFRFVSLSTVFLEQLEVLGEEKAGFARGSHMAGTTMIGPALAATLIGVSSYAHTYWVIAGLFLLTMFMSPLVFSQYEASNKGEQRLSWQQIKQQLLLIGRDVDLRGACMVDFTGQAIMMFYTFFIVVIAVVQLGLGKGEASGLVGAQGFSYVVALFTLGPFANRLGQNNAYASSAAVVAAALVLLGTAPSSLALWGGGLLLGAGLGLLQIVNLMRFARIGGRMGRGKIAGLNALVGPAGGMAGSMAGGLIGHQVGLQTVFLLFIPALALLLWQLRSQRAALLAEA
jgi:MFS family permease